MARARRQHRQAHPSLTRRARASGSTLAAVRVRAGSRLLLCAAVLLAWSPTPCGSSVTRAPTRRTPLRSLHVASEEQHQGEDQREDVDRGAERKGYYPRLLALAAALPLLHLTGFGGLRGLPWRLSLGGGKGSRGWGVFGRRSHGVASLVVSRSGEGDGHVESISDGGPQVGYQGSSTWSRDKGNPWWLAGGSGGVVGSAGEGRGDTGRAPLSKHRPRYPRLAGTNGYHIGAVFCAFVHPPTASDTAAHCCL